MELGEPDNSGRRRPVPIPGSEFEMDVDTVICALGTQANPVIAQTTPGLATNKWGYLVIDEATGATNLPGVFAGGDIVTGSATVILAMGAGRTAARAILQYLDREAAVSTDAAGDADAAAPTGHDRKQADQEQAGEPGAGPGIALGRAHGACEVDARSAEAAMGIHRQRRLPQAPATPMRPQGSGGVAPSASLPLLRDGTPSRRRGASRPTPQRSERDPTHYPDRLLVRRTGPPPRRVHVPLRPPLLRSRRIRSIVMPRSIALAMS